VGLAQPKEKRSPWPALVLRWHEPDHPLPVRLLRAPMASHGGPTFAETPPWLVSGPTDQPFDFTGHVQRLLADIVGRCPEFAHIQVSRLLVGVLQARNGRVHGLQARVTPLRFPHGQLTKQQRGVTYQVQRYFRDDVEFLYLLTFCLPRFLDQEFDDKFITLCHELYHIGPECNGDLRRHHGRYQIHTHCQRHYDRRMADLARAYLACKPDPDLHAFLRLNFAQLQRKHGAVAGVVVPRPKVVPLLSFMPAAASNP
jgi:predicted metallopeptidase